MGFEISMANFQLIEGAGNLTSGAGWDPQAFANLPVVLGSAGGCVPLDGYRLVVRQHFVLLLYVGNILDTHSDDGKADSVGEGPHLGRPLGKGVCSLITQDVFLSGDPEEEDGGLSFSDFPSRCYAAKLPVLNIVTLQLVNRVNAD